MTIKLNLYPEDEERTRIITNPDGTKWYADYCSSLTCRGLKIYGVHGFKIYSQKNQLGHNVCNECYGK